MSLVSLNEYKEFARISLSDPNEDEKLQRIADETESEIREFLNIDLERNTYTEIYNGDGSSKLVLSQFPIISVNKLEIYEGIENGAENWQEWTAGNEYERIVIDENEVSVYVEGAILPEGVGNVRVTYTAGYETIPKDIIRACKQLFTLNFNEQEGRRTIGLSSVGVGAEKSLTLDLEARDKILKRIEKFKKINV